VDVENDGAVESSAGADSEVVAKLMKVGFCDVVFSRSVSIVSRSELFSGSCGRLSSLWIFSEYCTLVSSLVFEISETFDYVFANEKKGKMLPSDPPIAIFCHFLQPDLFLFYLFLCVAYKCP